MKQAFSSLVSHHEVFRSRVVWRGVEEPHQLVEDEVAIPWEELDWRGKSDLDPRLAELLQREQQRPIDLSQAPLLRVVAVRTAERQWQLLWSQHHVIVDGWSGPLTLRDLFLFYEAARDRRRAELPRARPYRDYIAWLAEQDEGALERYWRQKLEGFSEPTPLVVDRPPPRPSPLRGEGVHARHELELSGELVRGLSELTRRYRTTLSTLVHALWGLLLSRYSGRRDVLFGSVTSGRPAELEGVEAMVGLFINTIAVRVTFSRGETVGAYLGRLHQELWEQRRYEHAALSSLARWSAVESARPLFESLVVFENYPRDALTSMPDRLGVRLAGGTEQTHYPLTLLALSDVERLRFVVEYDPGRLEADAIERLGRHLVNLAAELVAGAPDRPVAALSLMSEAERREVVVAWNDTAEPRRGEPFLHAAFESQAARNPERLAVVSADGALSYGALNERAERWARHLAALGSARATCVGVCIEPSLEMVVSVFATLKAGAAYVPLSPELPSERLRSMVRQAGVGRVLCHRATAVVAAELGVPFSVCADLEVEPAAGDAPQASLTEDDLAYVIFTSGSTGQPKGVAVSHGGAAHYVDWATRFYRAKSGDSVLHTSLSFDLSVTSLFPALASGCAVHIVSGDDPIDALARVLCDSEPMAIVKLTPTHLQALSLTLATQPLRAPHVIVVGGEALTSEHVRWWRERAPGTRIVNEYGPTETVVGCSVHELGLVDPGHAIPIGRPIANTALYVLDAELGPLPAGALGELYIAGAQVARGYVGAPALTAERFVPCPFGEPGARMYRTGDAVRHQRDGNLLYLGRLDHQVKLRGYRIELGEVEAALLSVAGVRQAAALLSARGGSPKLVGYVEAEGALPLAELRSQLSARLPDYMVPAAFVMLDKLPLTPSGKLDRRSLPAPGEEALERESYVAPRTASEHIVAEIWQELLGVSRVGVGDNFFSLGGDSITSIQVVNRARRRGLEATVRMLFEHPTVAELARAMDEASPSAARVDAEQGEVMGEVDLTPIQRWFFELESPEPHHFNQAELYAIDRELDGKQLEAAFSALSRHHDAFRLRYRRDADGKWHGEHAASERGSLAYSEEALRPTDASGEAWLARASAVQASLDVTAGPVSRAVRFRMEAGNGQPAPDRLLWVIHHLVVDEVSWRILNDDLERALLQVVRGEAVSLGNKTTSYKAWAKRLVATGGAGGVLATDARYWRSLPLATAELRRDGVASGERRVVAVKLDAALTGQLLREVPKAYRTQVDEVLLAALSRTLCAELGSDEVLVGLEGHGREDIFSDVDLARTVGWFTSLYPVALPGRGQAGDLLKAVKEALRAVPHRGLGYGVLRYGSADAELVEQLSAMVPQVVFNYLGLRDAGTSATVLKPLRGVTKGAMASARTPPAALITINAFVSEGVLELSWGFDAGALRKERVEELAARCVAALRELVEHASSGVVGYTPSDFALAELSQAELDEIFEGDDIA
jgi:amino acid adenylation domain-containing protein/non-ribosomal peptide synthase protein (TIGR01720 family)